MAPVGQPLTLGQRGALHAVVAKFTCLADGPRTFVVAALFHVFVSAFDVRRQRLFLEDSDFLSSVSRCNFFRALAWVLCGGSSPCYWSAHASGTAFSFGSGNAAFCFLRRDVGHCPSEWYFNKVVFNPLNRALARRVTGSFSNPNDWLY